MKVTFKTLIYLPFFLNETFRPTFEATFSDDIFIDYKKNINIKSKQKVVINAKSK